MPSVVNTHRFRGLDEPAASSARVGTAKAISSRSGSASEETSAPAAVSKRLTVSQIDCHSGMNWSHRPILVGRKRVSRKKRSPSSLSSEAPAFLPIPVAVVVGGALGLELLGYRPADPQGGDIAEEVGGSET